MGNSLHLEWFSESNGRVLIESADFKVTVSAPDWALSREEENEQVEANEAAVREWLSQLREALPEDLEPGAEQTLDEFESL